MSQLDPREDRVDWICFKCGKALSPAKVTIEYLNNRFTPELLSCETCHLVFVSEDLASGKMLEVEKMLEDK